MIRGRKSGSPAELAQEGYTSDAVQKVLLLDADEKCYICERRCETDYEVEHLMSRKHYPQKENDWQNLYLACGYCNRKKGNFHDDMLHPDLCDVEELITHRVNLVSERAIFSSPDRRPEVQSAIRLMSKVYNGSARGRHTRRLREQRFWDYFRKEYVDFLGVVNDFLAGHQDSENDVRGLLDIREEFLAFKYDVIKNNPVLLRAFQDDIVWNK